MRRILVLMTVMALMVVMLAMSVAPAFAVPVFMPPKLTYQCTTPGGQVRVVSHSDAKFFIKNPELGITCEKLPK